MFAYALSRGIIVRGNVLMIREDFVFHMVMHVARSFGAYDYDSLPWD